MADKLKKLQNMIYDIQGQNVMIDSDLAALYVVALKVMNNHIEQPPKTKKIGFNAGNNHQ